ncbi:hypothetical protein [Amycolatopsis sp. lyj-23]|uniref:hypothetical protein n=1 Tax=Amycolatopsis sp. lyj-23 TaxID=2789283 RepID=UPI003978799C
MHIYRCVSDEDDYIGFAVSGSSAVLTVHESDSDDGQPDTAELEFTAPQAHEIAAKLRELSAQTGQAGTVAGLFLGRTTDEPGILFSACLDGGTCRDVILSHTDAADLADRLTLTATTADTDPAADVPAPPFADLLRRATALRITATVFEVPEVDLFDAAEWVAGDVPEPVA